MQVSRARYLHFPTGYLTVSCYESPITSPDLPLLDRIWRRLHTALTYHRTWEIGLEEVTPVHEITVLCRGRIGRSPELKGTLSWLRLQISRSKKTAASPGDRKSVV